MTGRAFIPFQKINPLLMKFGCMWDCPPCIIWSLYFCVPNWLMINYVCVLSLSKRGQHKSKGGGGGENAPPLPPHPPLKETLQIVRYGLGMGVLVMEWERNYAAR